MRFVRVSTLLIAATIALSTPVCAHADSLDDGVAAWQKGDSAKALKLLMPLAEQGEPNAQWVIGSMYETGDGVKEDKVKALEWYQKAAEQGDINATLDLANAYYFGNDVPQDYAKTIELLMKIKDKTAAAQKRLGQMYQLGHGVPKNSSTAAEWYRKAAESSPDDELEEKAIGEASWDLAVLYAKGQGVPADEKEALRWLKQARKYGFATPEANINSLRAWSLEDLLG